jgi:aspartyl-tRNA(Asn)/glutamyl-tRNA(Gln) amidotransferase subunit A
VGKAHATENGMNPLGMSPHFEMPRNVYSSEHGAGGSSTGSAVAVALGLSTTAIGTDGRGSIRVPAAMNGVFGLKPTFNRLSSTGDIWRGSVGHTGPIGQSVADLVDLMEVAAAYDPLDPMTQFAHDWDTVKPTWRHALGRGISGCRIGVLVDEFPDADPAIAEACRAALAALEADGATLVDVRIPHLRIVNAVGPIVIAGESAANAATDLAAHAAETSDELRLVYGLMGAVSAQLFLRASRARTGIRLRAAAALAEVDVLALPTQARTAAHYPLSETGQQVAHTTWTAAMTRFSFLGNLTGLPAGTAPVGMHDGLPMGLQILGDAWDEASVLAVLAHIERLGISELPLPRGYLSLGG